MKRDWELIRDILNKAESNNTNQPIVFTNGKVEIPGYCCPIEDEHTFARVYEHTLLLDDSKLAIVSDLGREVGVALDRLTMTGHDFLKTAKNDTIWKKAMNNVKERGDTVSLGVLTKLLSTLLEQHFGLS